MKGDIMEYKKIKRNILKCKVCGDIIESKSTHDYKVCKCGACFVDGGKDYVRYGGKNLDDIELLTEYEEDNSNEHHNFAE